jgi:hypothetical protein
MKTIFYIGILNQQIFLLIQKGKRKILLFCSIGLFIYVYREIKIADFGTSKRLAGLQLCTDDSVGESLSI